MQCRANCNYVNGKEKYINMEREKNFCNKKCKKKNDHNLSN